MKQFITVLMIMLLLCGCGTEETLETVADEMVVPVMAQPRNIHVSLPGEAAIPTVEGSEGRIYVCEDYEIMIQTYPSGDLDATVREMSGHSGKELTVMATERDGAQRYDFVWASAGEGGDLLGRGVILDDGAYHYTMAVTRLADTTETSQISWNQVFDSFSLETETVD